MADQTPSLSEITNFAVDAERGTGTPAPIFTGGQQLINTINQNARFTAEQDLKKYELFQDKLKEAYKRGDEIAKTDVAPQDRQELQDRLAGTLGKIAENPAAFLMGGKSAEITKDLQTIQLDATKSKNDYVYDKAHRDFVDRNPSYQTDENKARINDFSNKSLKDRTVYSLDAPVAFDLSALDKGIRNNSFVKKTGVGYRDVYTDKKELDPYQRHQFETETISRDKYLAAFDLAINANPEVKKGIRQMYNDKVPENKRKDIPFDVWTKELATRAFGSDTDIYNESEGKLVPVQGALEGLKQKGRVELANIKNQPALINAHTKRQLANFKTQTEKDDFVDNYFQRVVDQSDLISQSGPTWNRKVNILNIPANETLSLLTFDGKTVKKLEPFDAKPIYDNPDPKDKHKPNPVKGAKAKIVGYEGGYYKPQVLSQGVPVTPVALNKLYSETIQNAKDNGKDKEWIKKYIGTQNNWLKKSVKGGKYDIKFIGKNGSTDRDYQRSALRSISNTNSKNKDQTGVFDNSDNEGENTNTSSSESSSESSIGN